jgi:hypothetical protein
MMSVRWASMRAGGGFDVADEIDHRAAGHGPHRVGDDCRGDAPGLLRDVAVVDLGLVDRVQDLVGGLAGLLGDIGQAAARVGQAVGGLLQLGHDAELLHGVVQLARDVAELLEDLGRRRGAICGASWRRYLPFSCWVRSRPALRLPAPAFCMIFCTFSSSVALVNGFTM